MTDTLKTLIEDPTIAALTFRQTLQPIEGKDTPVFPPTYPAPEGGQHRFNTPYTINEDRDGTRIADLDSVQSQANRQEAAISGPMRHLVPQHAVKAGEHIVLLTDLPHRIADAAVRATSLADTIRAVMLDFANGKPESLARLCPTALVYGAWDSRDTRVKIPRAIRSEIRAFDVALFTRSAQFTGTFDANDLDLTSQEWKKGADAGFAPTPSVDAHGGVLVHGQIVHTASILLTALRRYTGSENGTVLATYLLAIALAGLVHATRDYSLRSGCWLVPDGAADWQQVRTNGAREPLVIDPKALTGEIDAAAEKWSEAAGVILGGEPRLHDYDPKAGKRMVKAKEPA